MRPIRIAPQALAERVWRTWDSFYSLAYTFKFEETWGAEHKNKLYDLHKALRQGPKAVELFCTKYGSGLPEIKARPDMARQGWQGGECGYYDAIEALDFFVPLERIG